MSSHGAPILAQRTWDLTPREIVADGLRRIRGAGSGYRTALLVSAILGVIGIVALIAGPVLAGWGDRQAWTYTAIIWGVLMGTVGSAPCVATAMRLARGHWRRPVDRIAELWAAAMIVPFILFLLLIFTQPDTENRNTLWFGWPLSPYLWDTILMLALVICGYGLLYTSSIPDFAAARDQLDGSRNGLFHTLAPAWIGSNRQWKMIERGVSYLGALYVLAYVGTMTVLASDFILSQIPGDNSAIFPALYTVQGLESGIATVIVTAAVLRRFGGASIYLEAEQFFALAKLLLALGLLWFYFHFTEFIIWWFGRTPREVGLLKALYFGPYFWPFAVAFAFMFLAPLFVLVFTRIRRSIVGPAVVAGLVLVGQFAEQTRLMSAAFGTPNIYLPELTTVPQTYFPNVFDVLIAIGMAGAAVALVLLALKVVPYPSIWDVTAGLWLRVRKPYHKTEVVLIGKPD